MKSLVKLLVGIFKTCSCDLRLCVPQSSERSLMHNNVQGEAEYPLQRISSPRQKPTDYLAHPPNSGSPHNAFIVHHDLHVDEVWAAPRTWK